MRPSTFFAMAGLVSVAVAQPAAPAHAGWQWERTIAPNTVSPTAEQCAVLDAELFARAAPGLRDVRLVQDGRELAYATDISSDDRSHAPTAPDVDRALYETALVIPAYPSEWAGIAGSSNAWQRPDHPPGWFFGQGILPAHVPVERIRLEFPDEGTEFVGLSASESDRPRDAEELEATLTRERPTAAFTVGANLQRAADVRMSVHGDAARVYAFVLEMRRREICYQPLTASPIALLFGNAAARPVHYDYGARYQPKAAPLLASMGPVQVNPGYRPLPPAQRVFSARAKLIAAMVACVALLLVTLRPLLRATR